MRSESLQESLSALMDDEAEQLEIRRVLQASEQDPALRKTWERYQIARMAMHKEPWQPQVDLSAGIAAALADEPALASTAKPARRYWNRMSQVAVAASVTLAVLVGVRMVNHDVAPADTNLVADQRSTPISVPAAGSAPMLRQPGAVLAGFSSPSPLTAEESAKVPSAWQEARIGNYLRQHAEHGTQFATPHVVPYARAASLEGN